MWDGPIFDGFDELASDDNHRNPTGCSPVTYCQSAYSLRGESDPLRRLPTNSQDLPEISRCSRVMEVELFKNLGL